MKRNEFWKHRKGPGKRLSADAAAKGLSKAAKERMQSIPPNYRRLYRMAMLRKSPTLTIRLFCLECCCWTRKEVDLCTSGACPLYLWRRALKNLVVRPGTLPKHLDGKCPVIGETWKRKKRHKRHKKDKKPHRDRG